MQMKMGGRWSIPIFLAIDVLVPSSIRLKEFQKVRIRLTPPLFRCMNMIWFQNITNLPWNVYFFKAKKPVKVKLQYVSV